VSLPGQRAILFSVAPGAETHVSFPAGAFGGPVTIKAMQPVLASQRIQYYQSFNEVAAANPGNAAAASFFNWFDRSTPGMLADNIHILNPGTATTSVTVTLAGAAPLTFTLAPGAESHVTFPSGSFGGPVKLTSAQPVLATQRVQYYQSFNEMASG